MLGLKMLDYGQKRPRRKVLIQDGSKIWDTTIYTPVLIQGQNSWTGLFTSSVTILFESHPINELFSLQLFMISLLLSSKTLEKNTITFYPIHQSYFPCISMDAIWLLLLNNLLINHADEDMRNSSNPDPLSTEFPSINTSLRIIHTLCPHTPKTIAAFPD
jgi:hypothetical protein